MEKERTKEEKRCPSCEGVLEEIKAIAFFSMLSGEGYLCNACKMLYYHDLKPWVRVI
jgi:uncharacterized protein with PIN domain